MLNNLSSFFILMTIFMMNSMRFLLIPSHFFSFLIMDNSGRCGYQFDTQVAVKSLSLFFVPISKCLKVIARDTYSREVLKFVGH